MKRALLAAAVCGSLFASTAGLVGCKDDRGNSGTTGGTSKGDASNAIAIVNLDKVATDLGWITKMGTNLEAYRTQLKADLSKFDKGYAAQVQEYIRSMVPKDAKPDDKITLTPQQQQELTNLVTGARQTVGQLAQNGDQLFAQYRGEWIKQYREALAPIVRQVAQDKKMTLVLVQSDAVLFSESSIDLTNAVVDAAKAKPPVLTDIPMRPLEGPPEIRLQPPNIGGAQSTTQSTTKPAK